MKRISLLALLFLSITLNVQAGDTNPLVGTWKLVSTAATSADGKSLVSPMGDHPTGFLTYTTEGRISLLITHEGRPNLSGDRLDSPIEERANAFSTMVAYAGRYTLEGNRLTHHLEAASSQNWVDTDLPRIVTFTGKRVKLEAPLRERHGVVQKFEQVWERLTP
jgi:Lipocalin-like domain